MLHMLYKLTVKLFVTSDTFQPAEFVPVFHRWIQSQSLVDHLLIDVADYAHVPAGPGTLVVASEANIHMDRSDDRLGLLYVRKQPIVGAKMVGETLKGILGYALTAASKLQEDESLKGRLTFRTDEIAVGLNDRLLAANSPAAIEEYYPLVMAFFTKLLPNEKITIAPSSKSPHELIDLRVKSSGAVSIQELSARLLAMVV